MATTVSRYRLFANQNWTNDFWLLAYSYPQPGYDNVQNSYFNPVITGEGLWWSLNRYPYDGIKPPNGDWVASASGDNTVTSSGGIVLDVYYEWGKITELDPGVTLETTYNDSINLSAIIGNYVTNDAVILRHRWYGPVGDGPG